MNRLLMSALGVGVIALALMWFGPRLFYYTPEPPSIPAPHEARSFLKVQGTEHMLLWPAMLMSKPAYTDWQVGRSGEQISIGHVPAGVCVAYDRRDPQPTVSGRGWTFEGTLFNFRLYAEDGVYMGSPATVIWPHEGFECRPRSLLDGNRIK